MHSVTVSIAVMVVIVVASAGRRTWRKRALAIPIGMMLHLVFDGAFTKARLFWWPIGGTHFRDDPLPSVSRGPIDIVLELIGLAILVWVLPQLRPALAGAPPRVPSHGAPAAGGPRALTRRCPAPSVVARARRCGSL